MKKITLTILTCLAVTLAKGQSDAEIQIRATLNNYIEGSSYNKVDLIKKAFTENARLYLTNKEGVFKPYTPEEYSGFFKNKERGKFNGRVGRILSIAIEKNIATARAEIVVPEKKSRYIDLFLLKHIDGEGWKIISKTAEAADFLAYEERDRKLDNFTLQRLLILNDDGHILMEKAEGLNDQNKPSWYPPSAYSNTRQSITESLDSLALSYGIDITKPEMKAYTTYKFSYHKQVSHRSYFTANYVKGMVLSSESGTTRKWMPVKEALSYIPVKSIRLTTNQILSFPDTLWGGSFLISENGDDHDALVLEEFYPLFSPK